MIGSFSLTVLRIERVHYDVIRTKPVGSCRPTETGPSVS